MQFGTLLWILFLICLLSFQHGILTWLQRRIAAAFLNVGRGQGSAAGAAEDHMTCMLDALKCVRLMVRVWEDVHHLLCGIWYFSMLSVRCFEVHGTMHIMAAKSTTWSCLKRAWRNDLTFD